MDVLDLVMWLESSAAQEAGQHEGPRAAAELSFTIRQLHVWPDRKKGGLDATLAAPQRQFTSVDARHRPRLNSSRPFAIV